MNRRSGRQTRDALSEHQTVDAWNREHAVGVKVKYWKGVKRDAPSGEGATRSEAYMASDTACVLIEGVSGCIALSHVEVVK